MHTKGVPVVQRQYKASKDIGPNVVGDENYGERFISRGSMQRWRPRHSGVLSMVLVKSFARITETNLKGVLRITFTNLLITIKLKTVQLMY